MGKLFHMVFQNKFILIFMSFLLASCLTSSPSFYKKEYASAPLSAVCYQSLYGKGNIKAGTDELLAESGRSCDEYAAMQKADLLKIVQKAARVAKDTDSQRRFASKSDKGLCLAWMNYPSYNVNQNARKYEIKRRGIDCWDFGNVVEARKKANDRVINAIKSMDGSAPVGASSSSRTAETNSGAFVPLLGSSTIIGGVLCNYQDGTTVRLGGGQVCPQSKP